MAPDAKRPSGSVPVAPDVLDAARRIWRKIVEALDQRIEGVQAALPPPSDDERGCRVKAYEDKLDGVVCAAAAIACLNGDGKAFGDEDAAIWVPAMVGC
jgi:hypothetical protein